MVLRKAYSSLLTNESSISFSSRRWQIIEALLVDNPSKFVCNSKYVNSCYSIIKKERKLGLTYPWKLLEWELLCTIRLDVDKDILCLSNKITAS